ncbi:MAG: hypothetical protein K9H84_01165 [Bacteroidales bacterium]|nr:hypothetical protein [Bacteroidales bacterium]
MKHYQTFIIAIVTIILSLSGHCAKAWPGKKVDSLDTPGRISTGMAWDGEHLWVADRASKMLYGLNPATGKIQQAIYSPGYWPRGVAWDGEALWNVDIKGGLPLSENYQGVVYRVSPDDGTVLRTVRLSVKKATGLAWDGKYLWVADDTRNRLVQINPHDGTTIKSFKAPTNHSNGLTYDGRYLWVSDRYRDEIYMVEPEDGTVLQILEAPGKYTRGLAYDGQCLWAADSEVDKIFKLTVNDEDKYKRFNPRKIVVKHTHQVSNFGPGILKSMDIHLAIPGDRNSQDIYGQTKFTSGMMDTITDHWGQPTAHYHRKNMESGEHYTAAMTVKATLYQIRYFINPDKVGSLEEIPSDIRNIYLENNEKYQYKHNVIQKVVNDVKEKESNPYRIARKLYEYLIDNMYYEMIGGWNTAPAVIERGNGSCSEYAFAYIALCRAAGIPARYVGSVVVRGDASSMDDVFHRWAEIYLPGYGWIPVDPSGGDKESPRDQADAFGALDNRFLITTQSGGGSKTMEWTYNSNAFWVTEPKTFVVSDHFADWKVVEENAVE